MDQLIIRHSAFLLRLPLFRGLTQPELHALLGCLCPAVQHYGQEEVVLLAGYPNRDLCVLLEGRLEAVKTSPGGDTLSVAQMEAGAVFGDVLCGSNTLSPVTVTARAPCRVLCFPYEKLIAPCPQACDAHNLVLRNLVAVISDKYFALDRRVDLLLLKSLRAKLCCWLLDRAQEAGSSMFRTSLSRAGLAAYLNCERSSLSREIGRMQAEGLIETHRGSFKLLRPDLLTQYQEGDA